MRVKDRSDWLCLSVCLCLFLFDCLCVFVCLFLCLFVFVCLFVKVSSVVVFVFHLPPQRTRGERGAAHDGGEGVQAEGQAPPLRTGERESDPPSKSEQTRRPIGLLESKQLLH